MSADQIRAEVRAVAELHRGMGRFGESVARSLATAGAELNGKSAEFQVAVVDSDRASREATRRAKEARDTLDRCEGDPGGSADAERKARAAAAAASRVHETNRRALAEFERASSDLHVALRNANASISPKIPATQATLMRHIEQLQSYLAVEVSR